MTLQITLRTPLETKPILAQAKKFTTAWKVQEALAQAFCLEKGSVVRILARVEGYQKYLGEKISLEGHMIVEVQGKEGIVLATDFEKVKS